MSGGATLAIYVGLHCFGVFSREGKINVQNPSVAMETTVSKPVSVPK